MGGFFNQNSWSKKSRFFVVQLCWPNGTRLRFGSVNQCKWMFQQLVHKHIGNIGCGLTITIGGDPMSILIHP